MGKKNIFNLLSLVSSLIAFSLLLASVFLFEGTMAMTAMFTGAIFMLIWSFLSRKADKPAPDERQLKISAKANRWGLFVVMVYCIIVAVMAKDDPTLVSVPVALFGAMASLLLTIFVAYRILLRLPGADVEKWERR